ncbi:hypothetical protein [Actinomadura sp. HBU206391]|uniref:hypothetical protein n=1 Tax=Actinomadura sp. HBU206391 TaxID=2731692 RepID=UPI00165027BA|nr:hypothetical protein [Actinomadura sp. HBU206391]MBC6458168.1 hypothetical protein [Actinomadura sp. HBU206391]
MRLRTAALLLRLPLGRGSQRRRQALETVLRAADSGEPVAMHAVARELRSKGHEAVWNVWLKASVSGPSPRRWTSPVLPELLQGSATVPDKVVNAAWRDWLAEHDAALWSLLERWARPATASDPRRRSLSLLALGDGATVDAPVLIEAATDFDHPIGERARARLLASGDPDANDLYCAAALDSPDATAFCAAHHLAPADEVRRAVFFVRTGRREQYHALDPDGGLLALGYRSASAEERSALRAAMTALGGIDTLRVLAGQGTRPGDLTALTYQEHTYLVRRLTDQRDWSRLWSLTALMPLPDAVETVRTFGDWRPAGEDDPRMFEALRAADPSLVRNRVNSLSNMSGSPANPRLRPTSIRLRDLHERVPSVHDLDFAPDGTQLAFVQRGLNGCAGIIDIERRTLTRLYSDFAHPLERVAHLGSDTMVVVEAAGRRGSPRQKIHFIGPDGVRVHDFGDADLPGKTGILCLDRVAGDRAFSVTAWAYDWDGNAEITVWAGGPDGHLARARVLPGLYGGYSTVTTVGPDGGLIAVLGHEQHGYAEVVDLAGSAVNTLDPGSGIPHRMPSHAAMSPSTLVRCTSDGDLQVWHEPRTSKEPPRTARVWSRETAPLDLAWSPALARFLAVGRSHLELLDVSWVPDGVMPGDLVSERIPLASPLGESRFARLSPRGHVLAVCGLGGTIDLYDLTGLIVSLPSVVTGPVGLMGHKALSDVVAMLEHSMLDDQSRQVLTLLRLCLEHRFGHDVAIGDAAGPTAVADGYEIELGG